MPEKRSKYDTDPLDPDFVRRTEEAMGRTGDVPQADESIPLQRDPGTEEQTRRFGDQMTDSYPSVYIPPAYQPPRPSQQPFTTFGAGAQQSPAQVQTPPAGPSSPYQPSARPSKRPVT